MAGPNTETELQLARRQDEVPADLLEVHRDLVEAARLGGICLASGRDGADPASDSGPLGTVTYILSSQRSQFLLRWAVLSILMVIYFF